MNITGLAYSLAQVDACTVLDACAAVNASTVDGASTAVDARIAVGPSTAVDTRIVVGASTAVDAKIRVGASTVVDASTAVDASTLNGALGSTFGHWLALMGGKGWKRTAQWQIGRPWCWLALCSSGITLRSCGQTRRVVAIIPDVHDFRGRA